MGANKNGQRIMCSVICTPIEKIHPHMFRHTFVSILMSNPNIGVATVAAEAGHAQLLEKQGIYYRLWNQLPAEDGE